MIGRVGKLLLLVAVASVASCAGDGGPSGKQAPHDCLAFWGDEADALLARIVPLNDAPSPAGRGWAKRADRPEVFQCVVTLKLVLDNALGPSDGAPDRNPDPAFPDAEDVCVLVGNLLPGFNEDRTSGFHERPDDPGWLTRGGTAAAIQKAQALLAEAREALDM